MVHKEHGSFQNNCSWASNFKNLPKGNLFSSISFVDKKDNLEECSNPRPLGHKGGF